MKATKPLTPGFPDRTVIVTGGAHGFGRAIALAFMAQGTDVWTCDISATGLQETARLAAGVATPTAGRLTTRIVDITDDDAVTAFTAEAEAASPERHIGVLVNNAGGVAGQTGRPVEEVDQESWRALFAINVDAAFSFARAVVPGMKRAHSGRIVNISSGAGLGVSLTGIQAYAAAKAAQIGLTRQLAHELGAWNITVNNVAPGFVLSNPTTERQWQSYGPSGQQQLLERIAMKRLGTPEDIASAVLFFASAQANWITGQVLSVDGGK